MGNPNPPGFSNWNPPFEYRRKKFLQFCPDAVYFNIMVWMEQSKSLAIFNYATIEREIKVGLTLHYLVGHIIFWADPVYYPPYRTAKEATQGYDLQDKMVDAYTHDEFVEDDVEHTRAGRDRRDHQVTAFLSKLRGRIRKDFSEWNKIKPNVSSR